MDTYDASPRDLADHWDRRYAGTAVEQLTWYQEEPSVSLALIDGLDLAADSPIVDVGGGASTLAGALVTRAFRDVTVVDLSEVAVHRARETAGEAADEVTWIVADVRSWRPSRRFALWHDRAVFHFLTDPADRERYRATLTAALAPGGWAIVATFAPDGPEQCSGLPTARYDVEQLADELAPADLTLVEGRREEHVTPLGGVQPFTWVLLRHDPA